jgi:ATP-dependent helicase/nuclease subunit A
MSRPPVADQAERDRLVTELDRTLFVEAGAGTGKTAAVVSSIVARVRAGLRMERLVAITFTVAAAGELRVRIREALEEAAASAATGEERVRLADAASQVGRARIETIHAFCSALLRMHPLEAGLPPDFETLVELAADLDVGERFRRWFDSLTPGQSGGEAVRRGLLLGLRPGRLLELFQRLTDNWDLVEAAHWSAQWAPALAEARAVGEDLQGCIDLLPYCHAPDEDELYRRVDSLRVVAGRLGEAGDEDAALAALVELERAPAVGRSGNQRNWGPVGGANACTTIKGRMGEVGEQVAQVLGAARAAALTAIAGELRGLVLSHAEERRRRGVVTYHDLLVRARNLVRDHPDVAAALRERFDLIAVDEFQDTDPLQAELALRLCADEDRADVEWRALQLTPGRLCLVGDPKQSIYRFRRADIALYAAVEGNLCAADPRARARLSVNFRSGRRIIDVVNAIFGGEAGLMWAGGAEAGIQATYVDLAAHAPEVEGSVSVVGGPVEGPASVMWRREARATAAIVQRIRDRGWAVGEGTERGLRPCSLDDICILMPSRTNLRNLERELEAAGIRYRLESGSLIIATQEVRDLLNILRTIDDPSDQVALVAALRSPGYGCSDVELVRWKVDGGRWSYQSPGGGREPRVAAAMSELRELHERRHEWSVPGLIEEVLSRRLLRAAAYDGWRPQEAHRRFRFVADQARTLARTGRTTLHDTVDYLERLARDPSYDSVAQEGPTEEDSVRVMTVHAAKGLEFPIVIVTGLGRKPQNTRPVMVTDHLTGRVELRVSDDFTTAGWRELDDREREMEAAERVRLLYVALTRPRDHLVVSLFRGARRGEETDAGRLDTLLHGREDVDVLGDTWRAVDRPRPVAHADGATPEEQRSAEEAWVDRRAELLATLGGLRTQTATGLAHAEAEEGLALEAGEDIAASRRGRAATSLGRAVHAVLQVVDLETGDGIDDLARAQAAAEGIPDRAPEVAELARAAWASEPVRRASRLRHWREVPLGAPVDGLLLEGFIDLLYELPDGRLVVVDHKTDAVHGAEVDRRMERYRIQGGVYALLLGQVTGREVARIEFVFATPNETRTVADVAGAVNDVRHLLRAGQPPQASGSGRLPID